MTVRTIDNAKSHDVREVLAFVLRTELLGQVVSWMALRERLEYALRHWPEQPAVQTVDARRAATPLMRELQKTFVAGRSARAVAVGREVTLVRFSDSNPRGSWWFDERWLERSRRAMAIVDSRAVLWPDRESGLRDLLRDRLAVRHDWNTMTRLWRLTVAPGASVVALVGRTRRQPSWPPELVRLQEADRFLPGGLEQYYVPQLDSSTCEVSQLA